MEIREKFYVFDENVPHKNLLIHPIKVRDYTDFLYLAQCLLLERTSIRDPEMAVKTIAMSNMEFMFFVSTKENNFIALFYGLLRLVLGKKDDDTFNVDFNIDSKGKPYFTIGDSIYNSDDFDQIR